MNAIFSSHDYGITTMIADCKLLAILNFTSSAVVFAWKGLYFNILHSKGLYGNKQSIKSVFINKMNDGDVICELIP